MSITPLTKNVLGCDIGGVLVPLMYHSHDKTFESEAFKNREPRPAAFETLAKLAKEIYNPSNIFLVSYCEADTERKKRIWLDYQGFHDITNIPVANLRFCRKRSDKNPICRELGVTEFIDDRLEILESLETVQNKFWFNTKEDITSSSNPSIQIVHNWNETYLGIQKTQTRLYV